MSQRGGAITSDLRFGEKVLSPMIPAGVADFLVVLGDDQIEANKHFLKSAGVLIKPSDFDVNKLENKRTLNVALLGALSQHMDFTQEQWMDAIHQQLPERLHAVNEAAFALGRGV
jgi:indolepyruvate ferredoxin oxidoreductase beta subunit